MYADRELESGVMVNPIETSLSLGSCTDMSMATIRLDRYAIWIRLTPEMICSVVGMGQSPLRLEQLTTTLEY